MHTKSKSCPTCVIAQSKVGEVMVCPDCAVVHVTMASVSVRFDVDAFVELASMLNEAKQVLERAQTHQLANQNLNQNLNQKANQSASARQESAFFDLEKNERFH